MFNSAKFIFNIMPKINGNRNLINGVWCKNFSNIFYNNKVSY